MSKRESIAGDIITKLDAVSSPIELKLIKREPFEPEELSNAQFPSAYVQTGDDGFHLQSNYIFLQVKDR